MEAHEGLNKSYIVNLKMKILFHNSIIIVRLCMCYLSENENENSIIQFAFFFFFCKSSCIAVAFELHILYSQTCQITCFVPLLLGKTTWI